MAYNEEFNNIESQALGQGQTPSNYWRREKKFCDKKHNNQGKPFRDFMTSIEISSWLELDSLSI